MPAVFTVHYDVVPFSENDFTTAVKEVAAKDAYDACYKLHCHLITEKNLTNEEVRIGDVLIGNEIDLL